MSDDCKVVRMLTGEEGIIEAGIEDDKSTLTMSDDCKVARMLTVEAGIIEAGIEDDKCLNIVSKEMYLCHYHI